MPAAPPGARTAKGIELRCPRAAKGGEIRAARTANSTKGGEAVPTPKRGNPNKIARVPV